MPGEIRDVRVITKALEQRWPIKAEYRQAAITKLLKIIVDPHSSPKEIVGAAKGLLAAEAQNQKDEHGQVEHDDRSRFLEIAKRLGFADRLSIASGGGGDTHTRVVDSTAEPVAKNGAKDKRRSRRKVRSKHNDGK